MVCPEIGSVSQLVGQELGEQTVRGVLFLPIYLSLWVSLGRKPEMQHSKGALIKFPSQCSGNWRSSISVGCWSILTAFVDPFTSSISATRSTVFMIVQ